MPDTTPNYGLPFPEDGDSPIDVAGDFQRLAMRVDEELQKINDRIPIPPPVAHKFVSNKELTWSDLPTTNSDNGSLVELSRETRADVPVVVETGEMVERPTGERDEHGNRVTELVPETEVQYKTRTVYTYEADFDWDTTGVSWLVDVLAFRNNQISNGEFAFKNMPAAQLTALPDLDTSNLTTMEGMFMNCYKFNQPINFETKNVNHMGAMFFHCHVLNQPITFTDVSNVTTMEAMFPGCAVFNQPLNLNASSVTDMSWMFQFCVELNQPLNIDTSSVTDMWSMFQYCREFNQPLNWDTSSVANMDEMFSFCDNYNSDISNLCVEKISRKPTNFDLGAKFYNQASIQPQWGNPC